MDKPRYRIGADGSNARQVEAKSLSQVPANSGWFPVIGESFPGAWQRNVEVKFETAMQFNAVFACQTLIASDISKLRVKLVEQDVEGIWSETRNSAYSPVLRKPNHYQNRIQFFESWVLSKLARGNTYVLKSRDGRGVVQKLFVLDPTRTRPLVSTTGDVYYEISTDHLMGITDNKVVVPASEIIHDRFNCLFHPLVGLSPIYASGLASMNGQAIQNSAALFFQNGSQPGGIITVPTRIDDATAARMKADWEEKFSGKNRGKVAVLGDGMKFESSTVKAVDAQMVEHLKLSAEIVCSVYHVPPYKVGVGAMPSANNLQSLNVEYYSQCLQILLESIELCLDEGLATGDKIGTEFDTDQLLRMDSVAQMDVLEKGKSVMTLDERRRRLDLRKMPKGGATVYMQQQDHSLEAIAARDAQLIEQAQTPQPVVAPAAPVVEEPDLDPTTAERLFAVSEAA
ncbi:phage portal protein [Devosia sp.]|uniref:phage portal protein n=1 Tax=Devosia sp. TaxID=1871048 RepID=UPI001B166D80|nr:phage portal protein [Devosia sp.]MBO9589072.1 phage portal protein [Devosia sp.]